MSDNDIERVKTIVEQIVGKYAIRMLFAIVSGIAIAAGSWALMKRDVEMLKAHDESAREQLQAHESKIANHEWRVNYIETHP